MRTQRKILATAVLTAAFSIESMAQQPVLEEVIVVAQKREESLQDTAIAITALGADMLDDLNITNTGDYEAIVPSLSVRDTPSRLFLRGIGRATNSLGTEPGVAVYIDQAYSSEITVLNRTSSLTTERVEVLRGPQGTLFGRNATGGAVNIISKRPTEDFEHHVRATVGNYNQVDLGGSSAGPITGDLRYRVYGYKQTRDGYIENRTGKDLWDLDNQGFGGQLSWDATDTFNVWVSYATDETEDYSNGLIAQGILITPYITDEVTQDGFLVSEQYQWDRTNPAVRDRYKIDTNDALRTRDDNNHKFTTHLTWDLDSVTLKYIGYYGENEWTATDGDLGGTSNPDTISRENSGQFQDTTSHELQVLSMTDSPLQWVAGLYYFSEDKEQPYSLVTPVTSFVPVYGNYPANTVPLDALTDRTRIAPNAGFEQVVQKAELEVESFAAYIDANYSFNETWKLTFGLRYSRDEKEGYEAQTVIADTVAAEAEALFPIWDVLAFPEDCCNLLIRDEAVDNRRLKDDWDNVSGRLVLDYTPTDDDLVYFSVATGYKAGGFNLGPIQDTPSFEEETLTSYEIGYKGTFGEVFRLNAAAYFYDYEDMQVEASYLSDQGILLSELINAGEAEVKGLELEATWLATQNLTLLANYSYIDGEYTEFCCYVDTLGNPEAGPQDLSGNPLTQAPENKFFVNAAYSLQTSSVGEWVFSGSYSWVDERQFDIFDSESTRADSYDRLDAMVTWFSPSANWRVIASGRNLTEEETYVSMERLNTYGAVSAWPNAPRTYSLEVQYDF